jgi:hypothetical protein
LADSTASANAIAEVVEVVQGLQIDLAVWNYSSLKPLEFSLALLLWFVAYSS